VKRLLPLAGLLFISVQAIAQQALEIRGADSKYRYLDWSLTTRSSAVIDAFYVGAPGSNEFNLGGGYALKVFPALTIMPLAYAVIGKEGGQRGVKLAMLMLFERNAWKANVFLAHFSQIRGETGNYQVLDTADLTRLVFRRWEAGVSAGFFHSGATWNPQVGPLLKLNDRLGAWGLSYRFGPQREFRVTRVVVIKR
jgi:hypothetical protein